MTKAADLALGKIAAVKTALIEFTDGDDAIAVADAGVVTLLTTAVAKSEGGAVTTNITQGLTKAWVDYTGGSTTVRDSFNLTSVTDQATGDVILTWANDAANAFYQFSWSGTSTLDASDSYAYGFKSHGTDSATLKTASSHRFDTGFLGSANSQDVELASYAWNGDLA